MGGQRVEDGRPPSNLRRFLDCTTPAVETHILPKTNGRLSTDAWHHAETDSVEYFNLADLWEQYYEWSAYGAGATVQLHGGDKVIQYYVPYLSGIQLYTNKVLSPSSRSFGEDYSMDFWSDDEDNEKMSRSWSSTSDDSLFNGDVVGGNRRRPGHLYFEFFEVCSPYGRIPLMDKMEENISVSEHVLKMSGYADRLSQLGVVIPNQLGIGRVLQSLPPSYKGFVLNYNMQAMQKMLPELFAMLKAAEVEIKKENQVLMIKKTTSFKKKGKKKGNFKKGDKKLPLPRRSPKLVLNLTLSVSTARDLDTGSGIAPSIWQI